MDGRDDPQPATTDEPLAEFLRTRQAYHEARGRVLVAYLSWLDRLVGAALKRLPRKIERGEVRSEAVNAFVDVLDRFDPNRKVLLTTYAGKRVVGAIKEWSRKTHRNLAHESLDELLKQDSAEIE